MQYWFDFAADDVLGRSAQFAYGTTRLAETFGETWVRCALVSPRRGTVCRLIAWKLRRLRRRHGPMTSLIFHGPRFVRMRLAPTAGHSVFTRIVVPATYDASFTRKCTHVNALQMWQDTPGPIVRVSMVVESERDLARFGAGRSWSKLRTSRKFLWRLFQNSKKKKKNGIFRPRC